MPYQQSITPLQGGAVRTQCGPMNLVISSFLGRVPQPSMNHRAAEAALSYLERIARLQGTLKRRLTCVPEDLTDPLGREMVQSVLTVGDPDLTPMAAVAGAISDAVADFLLSKGMTRVVVENGGDVAIRVEEGEGIRVGVRSDVQAPDCTHVLYLPSSGRSWGVATSGLGGRSLTRGIASGVTVLAPRAALADAAATALANATFAAHENVIQGLAEEVDPYTDIPGSKVTLQVGLLPQNVRQEAVSKALALARALLDRNLILGALVAVGGEVGMLKCRDVEMLKC